MSMSDSSSSVASDKLGESPAVEFTGKIMMGAIIVLFMVVVCFLFKHLYDKGFWWRPGGDITTAPQSEPRRPRTGLDPSVLRSLPVVVFQSQDFKDGLECAVCLSELDEGEKARLLPKCNHGFHVDCIDMWFQSHSTCPLCRTSVASHDSDNNLQSSSSDSSSTFPTNVLIWGNDTQISSTTTPTSSLEGSTSQPPQAQLPCSSSSSSHTSCNCSNGNGELVIDIPSQITSSSLSPSASTFAEDELKSPIIGRLRSLKRLLSWDTRLNPLTPRSASSDVEQAGGRQS
ncbi:RING-H2 finger protein ATL3-like [Lotus japonicus]|uniref:RING-type E3 ubiquitin transferase n=1 Tax=Lotus japonicus TaxID=34305 RepID=I3S6K4_LOTJA|nr:RING-H2 finger protein ATL3-like [Lotus japonicus]AFK35896.1 unknown [Lotus japonicus]